MIDMKNGGEKYYTKDERIEIKNYLILKND